MRNFFLRASLLSVLMLLFIAAVAYRLYDLQVRRGQQYLQVSQSQPGRKIRVYAPRGKVFDRNGKVLIENRPNFFLKFTRSKMHDKAKSLKTLALLLNQPEEEVQKQFKAYRYLPSTQPHKVLDSIPRDQLTEILVKMMRIRTRELTGYDLSGIEVGVAYQRVYPQKLKLGHLLGYLRKPNAEQFAEWQQKDPGRLGPEALVGMIGVEKTFEDFLRGYDGYYYAVVDAQGQEVDWKSLELDWDLKDQPAQPGRDIQLSIDYDLSVAASKALGNRVGSVVVLDPRNGQVLTMVSSPAYHSKEFTGALSPKKWKFLRDHPNKILLNRTIQGSYPPGSTHKIVTAVAALAEGKVNPKEKIRCPGYYQHGKRRWGCWKKSGHGAVNLTQALKYSCDVYFYQIGERLGPDLMAKYAQMLGLGHKTNVLTDWEREGLIPTSHWIQEKHGRAWKNSDNLGNAIGQGFNLVSPLQNALMIAQFANGGKSIQPHLLLGTLQEDGQFEPVGEKTAQALSWKLSSQQHQLIKKALIEVVQGKGGTGARAKLEKIAIGGKTGTAQVVSLDYQGSRRRKTEDHAWFVAFAPAEEPEIAVAVLVEHGGSGGKVAAPIAKQVLEAYFKDRLQELQEEDS